MVKPVATDVDARIGAAIRDRRVAVGINQTELGKGIGVTFQQVQKYERGTNRVSASTLMRVADTLGCSVNDLLGTKDAEPLSASEETLLWFWGKLKPQQQEVSLALIRQFSDR